MPDGCSLLLPGKFTLVGQKGAFFVGAMGTSGVGKRGAVLLLWPRVFNYVAHGQRGVPVWQAKGKGATVQYVHPATVLSVFLTDTATTRSVFVAFR